MDTVTPILIAVIAAAAAVGGPIWLDIRKARREAVVAEREAEERREETRRKAAEQATIAHREALAAKNVEIATVRSERDYWRDLALSCVLPPGARPPSGREARR